MKPLIVANWKLNPSSQKEVKHLFGAIKKNAKNKNVEVVICPPFVYLPMLRGMVLGAQNVFWEDKGAFTGEVSVPMLKDLKIAYVILGHSERRQYFHETDELVNKKIKKALAAGLVPIFCIGETAEENQAGQKSQVLERQITEGLKGISKEKAKNVAIAYEPVWAIGTGKNCSANETMSAALLIRKIIAGIYGRELADNIKILYGGSVNSANASMYIKESGVNGFLVGGSSLIADEFIGIIKQAVDNK